MIIFRSSALIRKSWPVWAIVIAALGTYGAIKESKFIIIATPTNYDPEKDYFDTSSVEGVIKDVSNLEENPTIVIRSTIPIGFIMKMRKKFQKENIFYCPEFLREGKALYDNLYPSRIIIGSKSSEAKEFSNTLIKVSKN